MKKRKHTSPGEARRRAAERDRRHLARRWMDEVDARSFDFPLEDRAAIVLYLEDRLRLRNPALFAIVDRLRWRDFVHPATMTYEAWWRGVQRRGDRVQKLRRALGLGAPFRYTDRSGRSGHPPTAEVAERQTR